MSNPDSSRAATHYPATAAVNARGPSDYAEDMKKCEKLLTNIEAGFIAIMKDFMKKCGKPFTDLLKVLLECSICKGLITKAVSRTCKHTFCSDCLNGWIVSPNAARNNCPICRDDFNLHVKNPAIDKVAQLLVDLSFTEKEKEERINDIHQQQKLAASRPEPDGYNVVSQSPQGETVIEKLLFLDSSIPGRQICAMATHSLLLEVRAKVQLDFDSNSIQDTLLSLHIAMYNSDWKYLPQIVNRIPHSVLSTTI